MKTAAEERAAIVAWLRWGHPDYIMSVADRIERGDHLKPTRPAEPKGDE